ncbi:hypothetical protein [Hyphococcus sp.]|jgi:hypothetical protein|uniref:hypothetical protein n=1 Tax=Hyphococcus sp. TaxID=2038636 RepID=UPI003D0A3C40
MIRALLSLFLVAVLAVPAAAEDVLTVRAGEHGDYSRLVIPKAPDDWKIATSDRKIEITFPSKDYSFELSDILDKRKAHRVLNARIIDNEKTRALVLSLTCDCPVRTSKSAGNSIVIDIFNNAPVALTEEEESPEPVSEAARNTISATPESMKAARDRMIALLAEARHQGVVQLKIDDEKEAGEKHAAIEATPAAHTPAPPETTPSPDPHAAPLAEHAAAPTEDHEENEPERPSLANGPPESLIPADQQVSKHCVDPSLFHEPEDGVLDFSSISNLRQRFDASLHEDDRQDIAATLALAYIHIGFFEEAAAIASARGAGDHNMSMAAGLSDLGAGARRQAAAELAPYRACGPFGELAYAAAAAVDDDRVAPMQEAHIAALKPITKELRAVLAEWLGLNAIERNQLTIAREFYAIAKAARGRDRSPALAIMENALAGHADDETAEDAGARAAATGAQASGAPAAAPVITEELKQIAQTPGPLQARALAILAEDYEKRANIAYEGFLDDVAAQSGRRNTSLAEARASFTGAKALVAAGRMREGIAVLETAAGAAPGAESASRALAQSFIMNGLMADAKTRLAAVSAFFHYRDFVDTQDNGDLNVAVARELAAYGANDLVDEALQGAPEKWRADADAVRALSRLNSGDPHAALKIADEGAMSADLGVVAAKAHERLNDRAGTIALIKASLRRGDGDNEFANTAWRAGDWSLAAEAFDAVPKKEREKAAASRAALASLNTGAASLPPSVREALADDPETLAALAHMFKTAPAVSVRAIDILADYAAGVKKETDFMERGLDPATGDAR